jgi:adenosylcobinamide-phosphate synthase
MRRFGGRPEVLLAAVALDLVAGDPANRFHPVSLFGSLAARWEAASSGGPLARLAAGGLGAILLPAVYAFIGSFLSRRAGPARLIVEALLLKSAFSVRGLLRAAGNVRQALEANDLPAAREGLHALVSRDVDTLDRRLIASAAVESLAENATDSFLAPWFFYSVAGLEGALAYRGLNTLDSMWGYRSERYEHFGKSAARLDDAVNWLPAAGGARLLIAAGGLAGLPADEGTRVLRRDGGATESPNAGRMMSAMAGLLGVELEKPGVYRLGDPRLTLDAASIETAERVVLFTAALGFAAAAALCLIAVRPR